MDDREAQRLLRLDLDPKIFDLIQDDQLYNCRQIGELLEIGHVTVWRTVKSGELLSVTFSGRIKILGSTLKSYLISQRQANRTPFYL